MPRSNPEASTVFEPTISSKQVETPPMTCISLTGFLWLHSSLGITSKCCFTQILSFHSFMYDFNDIFSIFLQ